MTVWPTKLCGDRLHPGVTGQVDHFGHYDTRGDRLRPSVTGYVDRFGNYNIRGDRLHSSVTGPVDSFVQQSSRGDQLHVGVTGQASQQGKEPEAGTRGRTVMPEYNGVARTIRESERIPEERLLRPRDATKQGNLPSRPHGDRGTSGDRLHLGVTGHVNRFG